MKKAARKFWDLMTAGNKTSLLVCMGAALIVFVVCVGLQYLLERTIYMPELTDDNYAEVIDYDASGGLFVIQQPDGSRFTMPDTNPSTEGYEVGTRILLHYTIAYGLPPWLDGIIYALYGLGLGSLFVISMYGMYKNAGKEDG